MRKLFIVVAVLCMLAAPAMAGTEAGQIELGGMFTMSAMQGVDDSLTWFSTVYGGFFLTDMIELKGTASLYGSGGMDPMGTVGGGVDVFLAPGMDVVPFVGASAAMQVGADVSSDVMLEGHVGVKQFLSESTSVNVEARYMSPLEGFGENGIIMGLVGLSVYL
jgi:hypothetical protein